MPTVLLIAKTPLLRRLAAADLERLLAAGAYRREALAVAAAAHDTCHAAVRAALAGCTVRDVPVERVSAADAEGADLIVTVGGDGTVFTANTLAVAAPVLAVNSDPSGSIGHFTRAGAASAAAALAAWRDGHARFEVVARLEVRVGDRAWRFLNDCLLTSMNPAAMTRYLLCVDDICELQRSSGVWIATANGSTGAIRSAGHTPVDARTPALLWRVREPFLGRGAPRLSAGTQLPPQGLVITPAIDHVALYLDGPNITVPLPPGEPAAFAPCPTPLRLLLP
jgi:NAD+ kinase